MSDFSKYIDSLVQRFGTQQHLANAVGMSLSGFSRGVKHEGTLGVEKCLRLADAVGESPSRVLHLAGKGEIADLVERLYGAPNKEAMSGADREHFDLWRTLTHDEQETFTTLLRYIAAERLAQKQKRRA